MMGFVPIIVHYFQYNSGLSQFDWFPSGSDEKADFFFAWKMIAIIVLGIVMAGILIYRNTKKKQTFQYETSFYFLLAYALFTIMSALFSPHRRWAFTGSFDLFESVFVLFAYMIAICYIYNYVQEEKQVDTILRWSGIGALIVTGIAVFQSFGMDFFKTTIGKMLITNPSYWNNLDGLEFTMAEGTAYTTLYNPNFLSFYFGMLVPLIACLFIASKKIWQKALLAVAEIMVLISLWGSRSDSGWLALIIGIGITVLILLSRTKKTRIIAVGLVLAGLLTSVLFITNTSAGKRIWNTIAGTYHMQERYTLKGFETGDDGVTFCINDRKVQFSYAADAGQQLICATDEAGNVLETARIDEANMIEQLTDPVYAGATVQPVTAGDLNGICVTLDGLTWNFLQTDNHYYYLNPAGNLVDYDNLKRSALFRDDAMSFRGHIWNDTIPLLGKHVFIGSGANTFLFEYPQTDYIYNAYVSGQGATVYDVKAHNWYLQQWVENGLIGTLALLIFIGIYVVRSASIYRKANLKNRITWLGIGFFAAVLVYLAAAIVNDSNVTTAPVFWCILALGMAVNRMISKNDQLLIKEFSLTDENPDGNVQTENVATNAAMPVPPQTKKKKQSRKQRKQKSK